MSEMDGSTRTDHWVTGKKHCPQCRRWVEVNRLFGSDYCKYCGILVC